MPRSLVFVLMLSALYSCLAAQESRNQSCDLMVRIRTTNERIIETPVRVELLGSQGPLATANLVGDGSANFQVTSGKSYRLQVSGTGFQTVTTGYFAIQPLESEHTETIHLKSDTLPGTQAPSGQATISVSELNIPQDAAAELKKGLDAYSRGEMDRAANYFEKATAKYPKFAVLLKLVGTKSNRSAIGARVTVIAGDLKQTAEVRSGESYLSQNDLRLHFGLSRSARIDLIEIEWPSGRRQTLHDVPADCIYTVVEGLGIRNAKPLAQPRVSRNSDTAHQP